MWKMSLFKENLYNFCQFFGYSNISKDKRNIDGMFFEISMIKEHKYFISISYVIMFSLLYFSYFDVEYLSSW